MRKISLFFSAVILDTLTKLSTSTAILDDANCLGELAESALNIDDPTNVSSTAQHIIKQQEQQAKINMTSSATSNTSRPSWNSFPSTSGTSFYPKTKR